MLIKEFFFLVCHSLGIRYVDKIVLGFGLLPDLRGEGVRFYCSAL